MTVGADAPPFSDPTTIPPDDDSSFGFFTTQWIEPPPFDPKPSETDEERYARIFAETKYRHINDPTAWNRYCTLGRYAVSGDAFNSAWKDFETDPIVIHSIVWYNYMYHFERQMDIPIKLQAWATKLSQAYLATNLSQMITTLDTHTTSWPAFMSLHDLSTKPWSSVGSKKSRRPRMNALQGSNPPPPRPIQRLSTPTNPPETIPEAPIPIDLMTPQAFDPDDTMFSDTTPPTRNKKTDKSTTTKSSKTYASATSAQTHTNYSHASSDGKRSALIPNSNVPVNDGTYRVTLRWKTDTDTLIASRNDTTLANSIQILLNELFTDDDGSLYQWQSDGLEHSHSISQMTASEIRSYICPSIPLLTSHSMMIIPLRFRIHWQDTSYMAKQTINKTHTGKA